MVSLHISVLCLGPAGLWTSLPRTNEFSNGRAFSPPLVLAVQPWSVAGVRLMGWDLDFLREGFDVFSSCVVVLPLAPPR